MRYGEACWVDGRGGKKRKMEEGSQKAQESCLGKNISDHG